MSQETRCTIRLGAFRRWFIQNTNDPRFAWSGSRWVPATPDGAPDALIQVCNFGTEKEAVEYANKYGLRIAGIRRGE